MFDPTKIRKDFPIFNRKINGHPLVYLDNAATSQKPRAVIEALVDFYSNHNANIHRGIHTLSQEASELVDHARGKVADFVGVSPEEIVFVRNATEGLNMFMYSWAQHNLVAGDAIVLTGLEHHANLVPWQALAESHDLELRIVRFDRTGQILYEDEHPVSDQGRIRLGSLEQLLDERVKLVSITHASNILGTMTDPKKVRQILKKKKLDPILLVDASQTVPHLPVNFKELECDAAVFSGHKMLGPSGIGVFWAKKSLLESMPPFLYGGDMIAQVRQESSTWNEIPYKFEAGTPNIAGIIGLGAAVEYLEGLGMDQVWSHGQRLTKYTLDSLQPLIDQGWLELFGASDSVGRVGVVSFNIEGVHAHDVAQILDHYGIAIRSGQHCAAPLLHQLDLVATARASLYLYNTTKDIDYFISKLQEVNKVMSG
jgi:cysteine desulfurase/selenocysteine lyase